MISAARDLDGKVALVIGGSRNMGAEFAIRLGARGATTVISYVDDEAAAQKTRASFEELGVAAEAVRADATNAARTEALFAGVAERHGRLDIVAHLPGMVLKKPLADCPARSTLRSSTARRRRSLRRRQPGSYCRTGSARRPASRRWWFPGRGVSGLGERPDAAGERCSVPVS
jgi:NAD(P)-dependent dehydrogenase (short-subunit alcohol dehydrogenase family)